MADGYEPCVLIYLRVSRFMRVFFFFLYAPRSRLQTHTSVVQRRVIASFTKCSPHRGGGEEVMVFLYLFYPSTEREYSVVSGHCRKGDEKMHGVGSINEMHRCIRPRSPLSNRAKFWTSAPRREGYKLEKKTERKTPEYHHNSRCRAQTQLGVFNYENIQRPAGGARLGFISIALSRRIIFERLYWTIANGRRWCTCLFYFSKYSSQLTAIVFYRWHLIKNY